MICLGIDTTGPWCSVALVDEARILGLRRHNPGPAGNKKGHGEILADMVRDILQAAHMRPSGLDKIAVCSGPGSFTGPRIGLAFAKGLALPHKIPLVGLSALHVWAANADPEQSKTVLSVADIKRGQVCVQVFKNGVAAHRPKTLENDAINLQAEKVTGSGAHFVDGKTKSSYICPARLAWLGLELCPSAHPAEPLYHRPPDAKLPGGRTLHKA